MDINEVVEKVRKAQKEFAGYTQEKVDAIFKAVAMKANEDRIPLAKLAVEETCMGVFEDKVIKNHYASEYIYNRYKDEKTCGVIERDERDGYTRIAEPVGVVGAIVPTTNPTSTTIFKILLCLKTRNGLIISPHPRAKNCTVETAKRLLKVAVEAGAPENIIGWIDQPSVELSTKLMQSVDLILATGGPQMVRSAYSSGKPAIGVGAGNTPALIDESADIPLAVSSILHSKTFDNGVICASEQAVIVPEKIYARVRVEFEKQGGYFLSEDEKERMRKTLFTGETLNAKVVGQTAQDIAKLAGIVVEEKVKVLIGEVERAEKDEVFSHEKLCPVLAMYKGETFEECLEKADKLVQIGGMGHTACIYMDENANAPRLTAFSNRMKACRILVNTPASQGGIGDLYNFRLTPSLSLGCGSWGGNSVCENVGVKQLLNVKAVAEKRENMLWLRVPQRVYFKRGCTPFALRELKEVYGKKRAFIVTDEFLFTHGVSKKVTDELERLGIVYTQFWEVTPDPTLACVREGVKRINAFSPDVIIAIGGGSPMDAGKIMWLLY